MLNALYELYTKIQRLSSKGLFPYNSNALLRLIQQVLAAQPLYHHQSASDPSSDCDEEDNSSSVGEDDGDEDDDGDGDDDELANAQSDSDSE
jgi:hypothetical protein